MDNKPKVQYSEFRRMLEEMRENKQNSAQDSDNELTNNIKELVTITKQLTENIAQIISGKRNAPMGTTPFSAALQNSNNPKIQSDESELEAIKREEEQTELLRIIAKNTGGQEKFKPEKPEDTAGNGFLTGLVLTGAAIVGFFKGYVTRMIKVLQATYELIVPESLRKGISESFAKIGTFFSEMVVKIKSLFVFEEGSLIGKVVEGIKKGFSFVSEAFGRVWESIKGIGEFFKGLISGSEKLMSLFKVAGRVFQVFSIVGDIALVIEGLWKTISGAVEGWKKGGVIGAIEGALKGFFGDFIARFLDDIKSVFSWVLGALGFEKLEKFLDSFSIEGMTKTLIETIFHPIEALKKLGGVISDAFSKIADMFKPVTEFFSSIGKTIVGMLESIGIPEIGFTIPVIGKKVSIGPFYPFKTDAQKPVAPEQGTPPAAKTTKGSGTFNKAGFTPDGKIYEFKSQQEIDDAVEAGKLHPEVAETRREILNTKQAAAGMRPGETRTIVGGVPTAQVSANTASAEKPNAKGGVGKFNKAGFTPDGKIYEFKSEREIDDAVESGKLFPEVADTRREILNTRQAASGMRPGETRTIVGGKATPIPGGGQTVDPTAQNYNAVAAGTQVKAPERASPIVERKGDKIGPIWKSYLKDYESSTPADYLEGQYPGVGKKFLELAKKNPPVFDDLEVIGTHEEMLVTKAIAEVSDKRAKGGASDQLQTRGARATGLAPAASTGNVIEAKTGDVADTRDNLVTRGNAGTAIVNAPTTVNNTSQTAQFAKSPFRNEEGTINKYYSSRFGAF